MCGIFGVVAHAHATPDRWDSAKTIQIHRGPDGQGEWQGCIDEWHIDLAHQRLAILDLSPKGAQPMIHPQTGSVLIFNGEIYNFVELRSALSQEGISFDGDSDSEVLLRALDHWGIAKTLPRLNGMWAFAWLDVAGKRLYLTRDRCGEKPLYLSMHNGSVLFTSELKTMLTLLPERRSLNMQVIGHYLEYGLLDSTRETFISGIEQIDAGSVVVFDLSRKSLIPEQSSYWTCPTTVESILPWKEFIDTLRLQFLESVRIRLRSDVPVGILLSGGLDSSSIAGAAKKLGINQLQMLSAVSDDRRFDESPFIDSVAQHLNWPVTKIPLPSDPEILFSHLEHATWHNDAPVGSLSNVAHFLLLKSAQEQNITVVLSGQGADELLCGYRKFLGFYVQYLLRCGNILHAARILAQFWKNGTILSQFSFSDAKRYLPSIFRDYQESLFGSTMSDYVSTNIGLSQNATLSERQLADLMQYSVPTLNHFEDRMSMAWSREIRLPFLDPSLIELLIPAPAHYKLHRGWTKYALRCAMEPYLPNDIVWRKDKQGFINPQSEWIKHALRRTIIDTYFTEDAYIFRWGIVDRRVLLRKYDAYCKQPALKGSIFFGEIFNPLALEVWLRAFNRYLSGPR